MFRAVCPEHAALLFLTGKISGGHPEKLAIRPDMG